MERSGFPLFRLTHKEKIELVAIGCAMFIALFTMGIHGCSTPVVQGIEDCTGAGVNNCIMLGASVVCR